MAKAAWLIITSTHTTLIWSKWCQSWFMDKKLVIFLGYDPDFSLYKSAFCFLFLSIFCTVLPGPSMSSYLKSTLEIQFMLFTITVGRHNLRLEISRDQDKLQYCIHTCPRILQFSFVICMYIQRNHGAVFYTDANKSILVTYINYDVCNSIIYYVYTKTKSACPTFTT